MPRDVANENRELRSATPTLAILAGGEASRMGKPKGELVIDGRSIIEYLLDYTVLDGIKVPMTSRVRQGTTVFIFRLTDVKQNVVIDDARFDKPAIR